ncbi:MAG: PepSY-associated TM helix domain-containing protein [Candidatus Kapaibacterium sp.]
MFRSIRTNKKQSAILRRLFAVSRPIHKWAGLVLALFLVWMSISGILLNHPGMISGISVPKSLVPPQYHLDNWSRSALTDAAYFEGRPDEIYIGGRMGIWESRDSGRSFRPFMNGEFPESAYYRKTRDILATDLPGGDIIFAATSGGLYAMFDGKWQELIGGEDFKKVMIAGDRLLAFSENFIYQSGFDNIDFKKIETSRHEPDKRITLIDLFFELHGGHAWRLPGRLLYDLAGIVIIFLSISAIYIWIFPRKWKPKFLQKPDFRRLFKYFFKYHLKLGIIFAFVIFLIAGTGLFMRPPLLVALIGGSIPAEYYPGIRHDNPWHSRIRNAMHDPHENRIIIDATDGYWTAPDDFSAPFRKSEPPVAIFPMGATVFLTLEGGDYLIGSFLGLFRIDRESGEITDKIAGGEAKIGSSARPGDNLVTGYFRFGDEEYVNTHYSGLLSLNGETDKFQMPREMSESYRMPLWNFMFELHNGRIFNDIIGGWYILVIPLGSLLFLLIALTGVFDWIVIKLKRRAARNQAAQR